MSVSILCPPPLMIVAIIFLPGKQNLMHITLNLIGLQSEDCLDYRKAREPCN